MTYPIYKKSKATFHKINSLSEAITVTLAGDITKIRHTTIPAMVDDIMGDTYLVGSSRDEFEKAYGEAQWNLTQANKLQ